MDVNQLTKTVLLIINPVSGRRKMLFHLSNAVETLTKAGYLVTTIFTEEKNDAARI